MGADPRLLGGLDLLSAVVQTGSFVRAGKRVGLSQSGVSRAIARLEEQVGVRLFDRNARAVVLTDEGQRFHGLVSPLLAALEDAVDGAATSAVRVRGRLRINADPFFASHVLAPRLPAFLEANPDLELEVVVRDSVGNLVAEGFDAAVRFGEPAAPGLIARRLLQTRIVTCASPGYLARHPGRATRRTSRKATSASCSPIPGAAGLSSGTSSRGASACAPCRCRAGSSSTTWRPRRSHAWPVKAWPS